MRLVIRIGLNAIAGYFLFMLCLFIMGEIAVEGILGETLHATCTLLLLYFVNMIFNKVIFFQLSSRKNLWSITLGILILGLYFLYRILFPNYSNVSGIVARIALNIAYNIFATNCLIMFGLSILLNIILKRFKVEV